MQEENIATKNPSAKMNLRANMVWMADIADRPWKQNYY